LAKRISSQEEMIVAADLQRSHLWINENQFDREIC